MGAHPRLPPAVEEQVSRHAGQGGVAAAQADQAGAFCQVTHGNSLPKYPQSDPSPPLFAAHLIATCMMIPGDHASCKAVTLTEPLLDW